MNNKKWKYEILKDDAGQLSARRRKALAQKLARDPDLSAYRDQLQTVRQTVRTDEEETKVSDFALARIQAEAERHVRHREPARRHDVAPPILAHFRPALIYATISVAILLLGAIWLLRAPPGEAPIYAEPAPRVQPDPSPPEDWDLAFEIELIELEEKLGRLDLVLDDAIQAPEDDHTEEWLRELLQLEDS